MFEGIVWFAMTAMLFYGARILGYDDPLEAMLGLEEDAKDAEYAREWGVPEIREWGVPEVKRG